MLLVPSLKTILTILLVHTLLSLRPPRPRRLRSIHDTHHLVGHRQLRIDCRGKRMNQFRPVVVPEPQHGTAVRAEVPLWGAKLFIWCSAVFDARVFPGHELVYVSDNIMSVFQCMERQFPGRSCARKWNWVDMDGSYLIRSLPLMIFRLSAMPPRFTAPRCPPTLRQMLQAHSW